MSLMAGAWLHEPPEQEYGRDGKRAVVKHLCFGPLETRTWYESADGQFCREIHMLEGPQAGEWFTDPVSQLEVCSVINAEIALCRACGETELAVLFQLEKERTERLLPR